MVKPYHLEIDRKSCPLCRGNIQKGAHLSCDCNRHSPSGGREDKCAGAEQTVRRLLLHSGCGLTKTPCVRELSQSDRWSSSPPRRPSAGETEDFLPKAPTRFAPGPAHHRDLPARRSIHWRDRSQLFQDIHRPGQPKDLPTEPCT